MSGPRDLARRYLLVRHLGEGGMGSVYAAVDLSLGREVAAKLIREEVMHRRGVTERFRDEARLAAGFSHPNIVTIHDFGFERGCAFFIMELLDGITLRQELQRHGRVSCTRIARLLSGICAAMEVAHRRRLVHRDLKPENIMLTGTGHDVPKILDFGLAKLLQTDVAASSDLGPEERAGTLPYMAPEQLRGDDPQAASDLWTLGVLTFEMMTGTLPFTAPPPFEPEPASMPSPFRRVSGNWQRFFARALALDPARRPQSASAFLAQFHRARSDS